MSKECNIFGIKKYTSISKKMDKRRAEVMQRHVMTMRIMTPATTMVKTMTTATMMMTMTMTKTKP